MEHVSNSLKADKGFVLAAIEGCGVEKLFEKGDVKTTIWGPVGTEWGFDSDGLQHLPEALRADKDVMLAAIKKVAFAYKQASDALKADREVILAVINHSNEHIFVR